MGTFGLGLFNTELFGVPLPVVTPPPVVGPPAGLKTLGDIAWWVLDRLDDTGTPLAPRASIYYPQAQVYSAINEAQMFWVMMTLCLEKTVTWTVPAQTPFFHMLPLFPDWFLVKRLTIDGVALRPVKYRELDMLDAGWQNRPDNAPRRYATAGFDLLALYPQPRSQMNIQLTYCYCPPTMAAASDVPAIPEQYWPALVDYAEYACRQGEGGDEFAKTLSRLDEFMTEAVRAQVFYKAPNLDNRYEIRPFEITRQDRSKLLRWRNSIGKTEPLIEEKQNA